MKKFEINEYIVKTDKFQKGFSGYNFVVISDLHSNAYKVDLEKVTEAIEGLQPDAVLLCGDMFTGKVNDDITQVMDFIKKLAESFPVFFALGNHEYRMAMNPEVYGDRIWQIIEPLEEAGVAILSDETVVLEKDNESICLSGIEIDSVFYRRRPPVMGSGLVKMHLGDADRTKFQLLMAHHPRYFENYGKWGADLVVSGHVHGGLMRLPYLGGVVSPKLTLFPKYDGGRFREGNSEMILSRGLGTHTLPIRIFNPGELIMIRLRPAASDKQ